MAHPTLTCITAAGLFIVATLNWHPAESQVDAPPSPPVVTIAPDGLTDRNQELVDWAIGRFDDADLALPSLDISFHPYDSEECPGIGIALWTAGKDTHRIRLCSPSKRVLLHELGHAWTHKTLNPADRTQLIEWLGLESWDSGNIAHPNRGIEQTADIIAWGLLDRRDRMPHLGPVDLAAAYELLTGRRSPYRSIDELQPETPEPAPNRPPTVAEPSPMVPLTP